MDHSILIIDSSLTVRMNLVDALATEGLLATPCSSLAEARRFLGRGAVSVIIVDLVLPDGDGTELLLEVKLRDNERIAVVMLASELEVQQRLKGRICGADEYIQKPYDTARLVTKVRQLIQHPRDDHEEVRPLLVIDDSATFRETLSAALRDAGHRVITASTGEEGLKMAASRRPRAIIVDGILPGIDGSTVIRHVRLDAALRGIPCVLLTGTGELEAELRALDAGADAFVHKNEELEVIMAKLAVALRTTAMSRSDATASLLAPKHILAVDDSPSYREHIAEALRSDGHEVTTAPSGEEALELLSVQTVDCILLDVLMPGLDGKETCQRIKASPGVRDIPVILLTASEDRASMLEGLATGADDYIQKSAEMDVLKARVRAQLRRRQFEDENRRVRERLLKSEIEASEARAARALAETRAALVEELEQRNQALAAAYVELQSTQTQLVQAAKMASLGSLVAGVAHEVNNPLAFVLSHLGTAENSLLEVESLVGVQALDSARPSWDRARDRLKSMRMGLERIRDLVVKLRTFSRLDEGEIKTVNMSECIESVLTILDHRLEGRVEITTDIRPPELLECMPGLLNQAIMNLVANALDAIDGPGTIRIFAGGEGNNYIIRIEDSGPGIPVASRHLVLDPFYTTKAVGAGTGLGLSITDSIVKKHGGTLEFDDAHDGGAAALIRLPLEQGGLFSTQNNSHSFGTKQE